MSIVYQTLAEQILSRSSRRLYCVAIDGIDASGKSTLAKKLAEIINTSGRPTVYVSIDGFHNPRTQRYEKGSMSPTGYYEDSFNYPLLRSALLDPVTRLNRNSAELPIICYDHRQDREINTVKMKFTPDTILIFEGIFLFRPEINDYWDYRMFLDIGFETSVERGVMRDAHSTEEKAAVRLSYEKRYVPGQQLYISRVNPKSKADAVINNDDPQYPVLTFADQ